MIQVPVTAGSMPEWVRKAAAAVNGLINGLAAALVRLTQAEAAITALDGRLTTAEADIVTLQGDVAALDGRLTTAESDINALQAPTVTPYVPSTAPGSPTAGMVYFDSGTNQLTYYNGTIWVAL